ncbi:hypothetical protein AV521_12780 [Streptomyces sp. IMTB 2501]|nr:hypothetical protein AV521_12780 [Streptomyces sp. IMTB 2501]
MAYRDRAAGAQCARIAPYGPDETAATATVPTALRWAGAAHGLVPSAGTVTATSPDGTNSGNNTAPYAPQAG